MSFRLDSFSVSALHVPWRVNLQLILFDEAISSLDAHTQVQVMDLLMELKDQLGLTYVFITHDLTSVTYLCDEVLFFIKDGSRNISRYPDRTDHGCVRKKAAGFDYRV